MAGPNFNTLVKNLAVVANQFNDEANALKSLYLKQLLRCPLVPGKKLVLP